MMMLSSSSPVTAITRSARWMPARSSTHSSVASPYWTTCSSSSSTTRYLRWSDSSRVTSWSLAISSRVRFQPTLPAPTMITYTVPCPLSGERRTRRLLDRFLRRTDRMQSLLRVPSSSAGVRHSDDHAGNVETLLGDLRDHQVGVIPARGGKKDIRPLDPGRQEGIDLQCSPDREPAAGVFPGGELILVETLVRERIRVDHGNLMASRKGAACDGGSHAPGTDDEDEHGCSTLAFRPAERCKQSSLRRTNRVVPRRPAPCNPFCGRVLRLACRDDDNRVRPWGCGL